MINYVPFWGFQFLDRTIEARWRKKDWAFIMTTKIYKNGEGLQPAKDWETSSKCIQQASHECVDILCDTTQLISMGTWRTTDRKSHRPDKTSVSVSIETPKVCVVPCCACYCMLLYFIVLLLVVIIVSVAFCHSSPYNFRQTHRPINVVFSLRLVVSCHWCWCRCGCGSSHSSTMTMSTSSVVLAETVPASVAGDCGCNCGCVSGCCSARRVDHTVNSWPRMAGRPRHCTSTQDVGKKNEDWISNFLCNYSMA